MGERVELSLAALPSSGVVSATPALLMGDKEAPPGIDCLTIRTAARSHRAPVPPRTYLMVRHMDTPAGCCCRWVGQLGDTVIVSQLTRRPESRAILLIAIAAARRLPLASALMCRPYWSTALTTMAARLWRAARFLLAFMMYSVSAEVPMCLTIREKGTDGAGKGDACCLVGVGRTPQISGGRVRTPHPPSQWLATPGRWED